MATGDVKVTEGSGKNVATYTFTEDTETKAVQRIALSDDAGANLAGTKTDDKSASTDTTAVSWTSLFKQISASIQAAASALAGTLTVGTHAVTQSGTWTVQPGNTANTTAWKVDASSVAVPITDNSGSVTVDNSGTFAVQNSHETSSISNSGTALTPKFAKITASSSGANTVVAAVTSKKIRVLAWDAVANAAVNFKWQSHVTPTDLTGLYYMAGQGNGVARSFNPVGYFETVAGEALDINLSGAVAVGGCLTYVEV